MNQREIDCLTRLIKDGNQFDPLVMFLQDEGVLTRQDVNKLSSDLDPVKTLYRAMINAKKDGKLQLLSFEWTLLPHENIKLLLITNRAQREFVFET